jgi:hypothetical protein
MRRLLTTVAALLAVAAGAAGVDSQQHLLP